MSGNLYPGLNLHATDAESHEAAGTLIFGFWVFLMADLILFALLFATYGSMVAHGQAGGPGPSDLFELKNPFIETLALLASSVTMGMATLHMKYGSRQMVWWLAATAFLGLVFLALEGYDLWSFAFDKHAPPQRSGFLSAYFLLTGTHWLHVATGLSWMAVLAVQQWGFGLVRQVKLRILRLGLFWHMLDVVWVGIFSFVFLYGVIS